MSRMTFRDQERRRAVILDTLRSSEGFLTIKDLMGLLPSNGAKPWSLSTIRNDLDILVVRDQVRTRRASDNHVVLYHVPMTR